MFAGTVWFAALFCTCALQFRGASAQARDERAGDLEIETPTPALRGGLMAQPSAPASLHSTRVISDATHELGLIDPEQLSVPVTNLKGRKLIGTHSTTCSGCSLLEVIGFVPSSDRLDFMFDDAVSLNYEAAEPNCTLYAVRNEGRMEPVTIVPVALPAAWIVDSVHLLVEFTVRLEPNTLYRVALSRGVVQNVTGHEFAGWQSEEWRYGDEDGVSKAGKADVPEFRLWLIAFLAAVILFCAAMVLMGLLPKFKCCRSKKKKKSEVLPVSPRRSKRSNSWFAGAPGGANGGSHGPSPLKRRHSWSEGSRGGLKESHNNSWFGGLHGGSKEWPRRNSRTMSQAPDKKSRVLPENNFLT